jgi:hemerythrin superfamily protein
MNAHDFLTTQHREVENLYTQFESASEDAKTELGKQILTALTVHAEIEEELYYPELEAVGETELADEYRAEHAAVKAQILRLATMDADDEEYTPSMKALMEAVLMHVQEEESEGFPMVEQLVGVERLQELGPQLEARATTLEESALKRLWASIT